MKIITENKKDKQWLIPLEGWTIENHNVPLFLKKGQKRVERITLKVRIIMGD